VATDATDHSPPVWKDDKTILYVTYRNEQELMEVSRGGGDAASFAEIPRDTSFTAFDFESLRGGRWIAVDTFRQGTPTVVLIDPQAGVEHDLIRGASHSAFLPDGRVLFVRSTALLVAEVDFAASPPALRGEVRTIMSSGSDPDDVISGLTVSTSGHLAFVTGQGTQARSLVTVDREGRTEPLLEGTASYAVPVSFSPDGKRLAVMMWSEDVTSLWIVELDTGARRPMADEEPFTYHGEWLDDERIVFTSWKSMVEGRILTRGIGRNSTPEGLFDDWPDEFRLSGEAISFDGTNLAFDVVRSNGENTDIWIRPIDESSVARPLVATPANEDFPAFSPDGRWLAYESDESGRNEIYLRAHDPDGELSERVLRVSRSGAESPIWSADGRELFFFADERSRMLSAAVRGTGVPEVGEPRVVIEDTEALRAAKLWDAPPLIPMPDGERFLFAQKPVVESRIGRIEVVLNWAEQLER
jgi:serine/threonine-protein kinase